MTTEKFIQKAKEKWNNKFDYTKTNYIGWNKELIIACLEHGDFTCTPYNHLRSRYGGCQKCNPRKQITTEQFIKIAKEKFPDYDYTNTIYINSYTNIKIICKKHGEFILNPRIFLSHGCLKCFPIKKQKINKEKLKENFIKKANIVHGNKYDYSLVNYNNSKIKVKIICPIHGEFNQKPCEHISGQGCPECGKFSRVKTRTNSLEQFLEKAKLIHGNKYDYSLVNYINSKTKVKIICPIHGVFEITPNHHIQNHGCQKCAGRNRTTKEAIRDIENLYPGIYDLSKFEYINSTTDSLIRCKKHDYWFKDNYHKLTTNINRKCCEKEWQSNPNLIIKESLDKYKIKNIAEYKFENCKYIKELPFDFYLPDYNTVIEYQGEWHFFDFKGNLKVQRKRDEIKRKYCIDNNIKEIEIPYWKFKEIDKIIKLISGEIT